MNFWECLSKWLLHDRTPVYWLQRIRTGSTQIAPPRWGVLAGHPGQHWLTWPSEYRGVIYCWNQQKQPENVKSSAKRVHVSFKDRFYVAKWQKWRFRLSEVFNVPFDKIDGSSWRIFTGFVSNISIFITLRIDFEIKIDFDETWRHCDITRRNHFWLREMVTVGMSWYLLKFLTVLLLLLHEYILRFVLQFVLQPSVYDEYFVFYRCSNFSTIFGFVTQNEKLNRYAWL